MEKYILDENIIITTKERYEKKFKGLGYMPYKTPVQINKTEKGEEQIKPIKKRRIKED